MLVNKSKKLFSLIFVFLLLCIAMYAANAFSKANDDLSPELKSKIEAYIERHISDKESKDQTELNRTIEHDKADLNAQVRAATAAEDNVLMAKWQLFISAIGAAGLFTTIYQTHKSLKLANQGVELTKAQLLAYLGVSITPKFHTDNAWGGLDNLEIVFRLKNYGQIVAKNICIEILTEPTKDPDLKSLNRSWEDLSPIIKQEIPPGVECIAERFIQGKWLRMEQKAEKKIRIGLRVNYQDGYGRVKTLEEYWKIHFYKSLQVMHANSVDFTDKEESVLRLVPLHPSTQTTHADNS